LGKQRAIVAGQPAIEGPVAPSFEGMEQPQGEVVYLMPADNSIGLKTR
jgi:hypothetical protein